MGTISIFDDPDGAVTELLREDQPRRLKAQHVRRTRRRGGLRTVAEKTSMAVFGMSLSDLDREAAKTLPSRDKLEAALEAVRTVAGYDPDRAEMANGVGFAKPDVVIGHALASSNGSSAISSPGLALLVWRLVMRYRKHVPDRLNLVMGFDDQADLFD